MNSVRKSWNLAKLVFAIVGCSGVATATIAGLFHINWMLGTAAAVVLLGVLIAAFLVSCSIIGEQEDEHKAALKQARETCGGMLWEMNGSHRTKLQDLATALEQIKEGHARQMRALQRSLEMTEAYSCLRFKSMQMPIDPVTRETMRVAKPIGFLVYRDDRGRSVVLPLPPNELNMEHDGFFFALRQVDKRGLVLEHATLLSNRKHAVDCTLVDLEKRTELAGRTFLATTCLEFALATHAIWTSKMDPAVQLFGRSSHGSA